MPETALLITGGTLITWDERNRVIPDGAVLTAGPLIQAAGPARTVAAAARGARRVDARGGIILPGFINAHTHLYSTFARGMALAGPPPRTFVEILQKVWWRLDKALHPEDVYVSAASVLVEAVKCGTTTLIDHHASPHAVEGSLDAVAQAMEEVGVRGCVAYEVSDRDGEAIRNAGLTENERAIKKFRGEGRLSALVGLHASFTLSDAALVGAADLMKRYDVGCHIHLAEDAADARLTARRYRIRLPDRLATFGLLGPKSIAAHCVHIDARGFDLLRATGTWVVHNPLSNMNNAVGAAPLPLMLRKGIPLALGSDGFSSDMRHEMVAMYTLAKHAARDPRVVPPASVVQAAVRNNAALAETLFPYPLGRLAAGAYADVIVLDYDPPTPLTAETVAGHALFGFPHAPVRHSVVHGDVILEDGRLTRVDERAILRRARIQAQRLWARI